MFCDALSSCSCAVGIEYLHSSSTASPPDYELAAAAVVPTPGPVQDTTRENSQGEGEEVPGTRTNDTELVLTMENSEMLQQPLLP